MSVKEKSLDEFKTPHKHTKLAKKEKLRYNENLLHNANPRQDKNSDPRIVIEGKNATRQANTDVNKGASQIYLREELSMNRLFDKPAVTIEK